MLGISSYSYLSFVDEIVLVSDRHLVVLAVRGRCLRRSGKSQIGEIYWLYAAYTTRQLARARSSVNAMLKLKTVIVFLYAFGFTDNCVSELSPP